MKLKITFKSPDTCDNAIIEALDNYDVDREEREDIEEGIRDSLSKWIDYNEYVTIEFDTVLGTATVCKVSNGTKL